MAKCSFNDCERKSHCKGLCNPHYKQKRRGIELYSIGQLGSRTSKSLEERLLEKIDKNGPISSYASHLGACWIWKGSFSGKGYLKGEGYGCINSGGKTLQVHRLMYGDAFGPIPTGLVIDHLCRVHACCNPSHLEAVTNLENIKRGNTNINKTHCPKGHEYVLIASGKAKGLRRCKICQDKRNKIFWSKSENKEKDRLRKRKRNTNY